MIGSDQEIEAKFLVRDLEVIEARLRGLGAALTAERVFETNLRFDTPDGDLSRQRQALRLRQDTQSIMTFKGAARQGEAISMREEIEFSVSDFAAARRLLEALGYVVSVIYEKYRTTYVLGNLEVVLDELPFGSFIEIEGPDVDTIRGAADELGLEWEARSSASYLALFGLFREARNLSARNLTFEELRGIEAAPEDLKLRYAA
jgi:adenylate cyclase class 2